MAQKPSNRLVRKAIRELMEPAIRALSFEGKYPNFTRLSGEEIHFLELWTAKYGGSFSYSLGWCKKGPLIDWDGKTIAESDIKMSNLPFESRAQACHMIDLWALDGTPLRCSDGIFEYALFVEGEQQCRDLVDKAVATLPEADNWLRTRECRDAIWPTGKSPPTGTESNFSAQILINKNEHRVRSMGLLE